MTLRLDHRLEDVSFVRGAIDRRIFKPVDVWPKSRTDESEPVKRDPAVVFACGDMGQSPDRINHCYGRISDHIQWIQVTGGALLLDAVTPAGQMFDMSDKLIKMVDRTVAIWADKGVTITRIVLIGDFQCGVAEQVGMTTRDTVRSLIHVKRLFKDRFPRLEVALKFYLDHPAEVLGHDHPLVVEHPERRGLTFYFSSKEMEEYLAEFSRPLATTWQSD